MKKLLTALLLVAVSVSFNVPAATLDVVPTKWRLENYIGGTVVDYFTGSSCASGRLLLPGNATTEDKNRFWSLIMAAKISQKRIVVIYDDNGNDCPISSFILREE